MGLVWVLWVVLDLLWCHPPPCLRRVQVVQRWGGLSLRAAAAAACEAEGIDAWCGLWLVEQALQLQRRSPPLCLRLCRREHRWAEAEVAACEAERSMRGVCERG